MNDQLLLSKRLFEEASRFAEHDDAISCGLAISLLQDAAEMLVWALIKHRNVSTKDQSTFTLNLDLLERDGVVIAQKSKLLELNKARVGFKHYGNLPNPSEATKFQNYVEDFLRESTRRDCGIEWDELSLIDLLPYPEIRAHLKSADSLISKGELHEAVKETSVAKSMLFGLLGRFVPAVDSGLGRTDDTLALVPELQGVQVFTYLAQYLEMLREVSLVSFLGFPLAEYHFLQRTLFNAHKMMNGEWLIDDSKFWRHDEQTCRRQIKYLVAFGIRAQGMLRARDA